MASTSEWNRFFIDAKIPKHVAAQYAVIFNTNRISFDMLMDLNKEYLKDMEITVLGDVISILKHAKEVQSKRSTDKILKPGSNGEKAEQASVPTNQSSIPRKVIKLVPAEKPAPIMTKPDEKSIASRLGPPKEQLFRKNTEAKKPVFSRLDGRTPEKAASPVRDGSKSPGILRKRIRDDPDERNIVSSSSSSSMRILKRPSERTHDKRVSFNSSSSDEEEPLTKKKKKYVMVQTLANGTKVKSVIDPSDPILQRYDIQKRSLSSSNLDSRSSMSARLGRKISPPRDTASSVRSRVGSRHVEESLNADREQQKSVKSRLSVPVSIRRLSSPSSRYDARERVQEAVARKRITPPAEREDGDHHYRNVNSASKPSLASRLGPKVGHSGRKNY